MRLVPTAAAVAITVLGLLASGCTRAVRGSATFGPAGSAPSTSQPLIPGTVIPSGQVGTDQPGGTAGGSARQARTVVCAKVGAIVEATNAALNRLSDDATLAARRAVARSFAAGSRQMTAALRSMPALPTDDPVGRSARTVIIETGRVATLLGSGAAFDDGDLVAAQNAFTGACGK